MKGERKIKTLIGKTVKNIEASKCSLKIVFEDNTILYYHLTESLYEGDINVAEIIDDPDKAGLFRYNHRM